MDAKRLMSNETLAFIEKLGNVDVLIGIPSLNSAESIGFVAKQASLGLKKYFGDKKTLIVNSDCGSKDNNCEVFLNNVEEGVQKLANSYNEPPGKGKALGAFFEMAKMLNAKACVCVDSDLRSITPEWIKLYVEPILEGKFDYVTPNYIRHKYDGTITNSIAYPLTRALYGKSVRQPIGGDFGFSGHLAAKYLASPGWDHFVDKFGIDILMTTVAINDGAKIGQVNLGAKIHDAKDPGSSLGPMFEQVIGTLFNLMGIYKRNWEQSASFEKAPIYGPEISLNPEPVNVNINILFEKFLQGYNDFGSQWKSFLTSHMWSVVEKLAIDAKENKDNFEFTKQNWAHLVFEFAHIYNKGEKDKKELMNSMIPLYFARTASFVIQTKDYDAGKAEAEIENVAETYEKEKKYLLRIWK